MKERRLNKRLLLVLVVIAAMILPMTQLISYAWFALTSVGIGSLARVEKPAPFAITGPYGVDGSDIQIDFISVNATVDHQAEGIGKKQYLFCVEGVSSIKQYEIVIAHTTNVNFTYSVQMADKVQSEFYSEEYAGQILEHPFYYSNHMIQFDSYNRDGDLAIRDANKDVYYKKTYHEGGTALPTEYVQKNAMPIYEHALIELGEDYNGKQYYILNVTWSIEEDSLENKLKETDMVYVFVKTVVSGEDS